MGGDLEDQWLRYTRYRMLVRRSDIRRLIILAIAVISASWLLFEVTNHDLYSFVPLKQTMGASSAGSESADVSGHCTTWPVAADGAYKSQAHYNSSLALRSYGPKGGWKKPAGIKIVALVFYGRKRTVDFLDCYLQQNLAANGGYLDEVQFMVHTEDEDDLKYLDGLVKQRKHYHTVQARVCDDGMYGCIWDSAVDDETIYIKIDDDIVFIHPDTIPQLVHTRIASPHPFAVSANLVNSPLTGYKHYHFGAIHAFRPDPNSQPSRRPAESWRPSAYGRFPESSFPNLNNHQISNLSEEVVEEHVFPDIPYPGHPWLLLSDDPYDMLKTPMGLNWLRAKDVGTEGVMGAAWSSWAISAQQQYSLLKNLEDNAMHRYFFGVPLDFPEDEEAGEEKEKEEGRNDGEPESGREVALRYMRQNGGRAGAEQLLDTQYVRYNLNFVAVWGHDVRDNLPIAPDDEEDLTVAIPKRTRRPFVIDSRAVVGHLSFFPQHDGVRETDLLDRWRAFANEMVCKPGNRKKPFDRRCPGF
ncbi:hypothetical protein F4779DRAFT_608400 [Xylariaceae sp. FL0662B]|nr:hypothetical protein F4779DRAFT_608400 [Xylariaceae sp. FL0662B]